MDEKKTIEFMIKLYCKKNHSKNYNIDKDSGLCEECQKLIEYANKKADNCRQKDTKTFCSVCKTHCYSPNMRLKIKSVMKFSGPRMLIYNPHLAISHIVSTIKGKIENKGN